MPLWNMKAPTRPYDWWRKRLIIVIVVSCIYDQAGVRDGVSAAHLPWRRAALMNDPGRTGRPRRLNNVCVCFSIDACIPQR